MPSISQWLGTQLRILTGLDGAYLFEPASRFQVLLTGLPRPVSSPMRAPAPQNTWCSIHGDIALITFFIVVTGASRKLAGSYQTIRTGIGEK